MEIVINLDHYFFKLINQGLSNAFLDQWMPILRNKATWYPFYILIAIFLVYKWKLQGFYLILFTVLSVAISDLISSHVLKEFFARTRPCNLQDFASSSNLLIEKCSGAYSFPSSHAANHFAIASFLSFSFRHKGFSLAMFFWASLICLAQIYVGVHFPLDVIFGAVLGFSLGYIVYKIKKAVIKTAF